MRTASKDASPAIVLAALLGIGVALSAVGACGDNRGNPTAHTSATGGNGTGATGGGVVSGACSQEGAVRECYITLNEHDGIVNCFVGQQECLHGSWTECAGDARLVSGPGSGQTARSSDGEGMTPRALTGGASPVASGCNACNPYCVGYEEDPDDIAPEYVVTPGSFWGANLDAAGVPPGFDGKLNCEDCSISIPPRDKCGGEYHYVPADTCQADSRCVGGACERAGVGWTWPATTCAGVDLTIGYTCAMDATYSRYLFPLCNRGNTAVPGGPTSTPIDITISGSPSFFDLGDCEPSGGSVCSVQLDSDLGPGECVAIISDGPAEPGQYVCPTPSVWPGGNTVAMVNVGNSAPITECPDPGCHNNWSDVKQHTSVPVCVLNGTAGFSQLVVSEDYTATCPVGTFPVWENLYWDALIRCSPGACDGTNESVITFAVQTADSWDATPTFEPAAPITVATVRSANPAQCLPTTAPSGSCPVDLSALPNPASSYDDTLRLTMTLDPTADFLNAPRLDNWQITYSCVPGE